MMPTLVFNIIFCSLILFCFGCDSPCAPVEATDTRCLVGTLGEEICISKGSVVMFDADALVR